eukprot:scaffold7279_cov69-Cylindrotheca_fusiformis.AAC.1
MKERVAGSIQPYCLSDPVTLTQQQARRSMHPCCLSDPVVSRIVVPARIQAVNALDRWISFCRP